MLRDGGCHWLTAMRSILQWKSFKPWLTVCPYIMYVCMHVFPAQTCVSMRAYVHYACVQVFVCVTVCPCHCVGIQTCLLLKTLDADHLHSAMRNRFKFRDSFQDLLFAVTFKSKSISAAFVVLLLGLNIFPSSVSDERFSLHRPREVVCWRGGSSVRECVFVYRCVCMCHSNT